MSSTNRPQRPENVPKVMNHSANPTGVASISAITDSSAGLLPNSASCRPASVILKRCSSFSYAAKSRIRRCSTGMSVEVVGRRKEVMLTQPPPPAPLPQGEGGFFGRAASQQQAQRILDNALELAQPARAQRAIDH